MFIGQPFYLHTFYASGKHHISDSTSCNSSTTFTVLSSEDSCLSTSIIYWFIDLWINWFVDLLIYLLIYILCTYTDRKIDTHACGVLVVSFLAGEPWSNWCEKNSTMDSARKKAFHKFEANFWYLRLKLVLIRRILSCLLFNYFIRNLLFQIFLQFLWKN